MTGLWERRGERKLMDWSQCFVSVSRLSKVHVGNPFKLGKYFTVLQNAHHEHIITVPPFF